MLKLDRAFWDSADIRALIQVLKHEHPGIALDRDVREFIGMNRA